MSSPEFDWKLKGGYGELIREGDVEARLRGKTWKLVAALSPTGLARRIRPVDLDFVLRRPLRAEFPGGGVLRLHPEGSLRARILFSRNAFLGNFRVAENHFGIQWTVQGAVEAEAALWGLARVEAGTRLSSTWVTEFPLETGSPSTALLESWRAWLTLLDARQAPRIGEGQVHRLFWSGDLKTAIEVNWSLLEGWSIPAQLPFLKVTAAASALAGASLDFSVRRRGRFQLQLSRRRQKTVLSLRQVRELKAGVTAQARIGAATAVRLSRISSRRPQLDRYAIQPLSQPLIQQANRRLSNAVVRRLQTSLSIELSRKRGQTRLFRVEWQSHQEQSVRFAYQDLLGGRLPSPLPGVRISGVFESVRQKSIRVALNLFDWMILRGEKSTQRIERASLTPGGHLLIERADSLERLRETRRSRQLASVLLRDIEERKRKSTNLRWSLAREGRFDRRRLRQWLRLGLHSRILDSATLPGRKRFPLRLRFLLVSEYSSASREDWWMTLIRVLEIQAPNHWRDWIDFPEVSGKPSIAIQFRVTWLAVTRFPVADRSSDARLFRNIFVPDAFLICWMDGNREIGSGCSACCRRDSTSRLFSFSVCFVRMTCGGGPLLYRETWSMSGETRRSSWSECVPRSTFHVPRTLNLQLSTQEPIVERGTWNDASDSERLFHAVGAK